MKYDFTFTGFYGMKNFGDDLFGYLSSINSAKYWAGNTFLATPSLKRDIDTQMIPGVYEEVFSSYSVAGKLLRLYSAVSNVAKSQRVIFAGGSLFTSESSKINKLMINATKKNTFSAIGISVGPFESVRDEVSTINLLKKFEFISVRDSSSMEILSNYSLNSKIVQAADLAGLIEPKEFERSKNLESKLIGFSPCFIKGDSRLAKEYCDKFINAVCSLRSEEKIKCIILSLNNNHANGDDSLAHYTYERLTSAEVSSVVIKYSDCGIKNMLKIISNLDLYISVRLHGAISAFMLGTSFYLFEYHKKCTDFLDDIHFMEFQSLRTDKEVNFCGKMMSQMMENKTAITKARRAFASKSKLNFIEAPWF